MSIRLAGADYAGGRVLPAPASGRPLTAPTGHPTLLRLQRLTRWAARAPPSLTSSPRDHAG